MYINLRNVEGVYQTKSYDDFMIYAQVLDSGMSYERPVLVRTVDELDIWFGKDFEGREHLIDLLSNNITLYLYQPISSQGNKKSEGYIDTDSFHTDPTTYLDLSEIIDPKENTIYEVAGINYIHLDGQFIKISDLPQNLNINSISLNNRDTLALTNHSVYSHYSYVEGGKVSLPPSAQDILDRLEEDFSLTGGYLMNLVVRRLENKTGGLVFKVSSDSSRTIDNTKDIQYFLIGGKLLYSTPNNENLKTNSSGDITNLIMPDGKVIPRSFYYRGFTKCDKNDNVLNNLSGLSNGSIDLPNSIIYMADPQPDIRLSNWQGQNEIITDYATSWDIVTKSIESDIIIKFWSKTIGRDGTGDDSISIKTKKLGDDLYEFTISRYDYKEVFEGSLGGRGDAPRIDLILNKSSKLVYSEVLRSDRELPEGSWKLSGAVKEEIHYTFGVYQHALDVLLGKDEQIHFDFLLVPDLNKYIKSKYDNVEWSVAQEWIFDRIKNLNTQALIQVQRVEEQDSLTSYTGDKENRVIYFYNPIFTKTGLKLPGYYVFLRGLNSDIYSVSTKDILYDSPINVNDRNILDRDNYPDIIRDLVSNKINYLLDNGQYYYYDGFQNGENPKTSIWMRFCLGKICRELEKLKPELVGQRNSVKMRELIEKRLQKVQDRFSIIRSLSINGFFFDPGHSKLYIEINTSVSDLVSEDIVLDLTINFK